MKFIVRPLQPTAVGKMITLCMKCSENPQACL